MYTEQGSIVAAVTEARGLNASIARLEDLISKLTSFPDNLSGVVDNISRAGAEGSDGHRRIGQPARSSRPGSTTRRITFRSPWSASIRSMSGFSLRSAFEQVPPRDLKNRKRTVWRNSARSPS